MSPLPDAAPPDAAPPDAAAAPNPPLVPDRLLARVARRLKVLGDPVRLELLNHLRIHGATNVQTLVDATGHRQANVSKHLGILMREGLVTRRKEGVQSFYTLADPSLPGVCVLLTNQLRATEPAEPRP
jgi:ArsR family transcriptional regulator